MVSLSTRAPFASFLMALKISTQTQTRIPAKASLTNWSWAKLDRKAAITVMITREGNTTPRVAMIPPVTPFRFMPMKVAVFTAMTPGVHWPTA